MSAQNGARRATGRERRDIAAETLSGASESTCGVCGAPVHDAYICRRCTSVLADDLIVYTRASTSLVDELTVTATRQARMTRPGDGGRSSERPLPFDERASTILADDAAWLSSACVAFGAPALLVVETSPGVCAEWLWRHVERIATYPHAIGFAHDAARRAKRAVRAIDRPPGTWYAGRCIECSHDLYAAEGAGVVECRSCGTTHDVEAQRARLLQAVEDRLATASEICRAVHLLDRPVTRSQIDHWVDRGLIARRGRSTAGHFLYRIGDVLTLVASGAQVRR